jgi:hypothetical protein
MRAFELSGVTHHRLPDLLETRKRGGFVRLAPRAVQRGQENSDQDRDDADHHKQFDERKRATRARAMAEHMHLVQQIDLESQPGQPSYTKLGGPRQSMREGARTNVGFGAASIRMPAGIPTQMSSTIGVVAING